MGTSFGCPTSSWGMASGVPSTDSPSGFWAGFFNTSSGGAVGFTGAGCTACSVRSVCAGRAAAGSVVPVLEGSVAGSVLTSISGLLGSVSSSVVTASVVSAGMTATVTASVCFVCSSVWLPPCVSPLNWLPIAAINTTPTTTQPRTASRRFIRSFSFIDYASSYF